VIETNIAGTGLRALTLGYAARPDFMKAMVNIS
jgi:hypothetical protein